MRLNVYWASGVTRAYTHERRDGEGGGQTVGRDAEPVEFPNATRCVDKSRYDEGVWAHEES